MNKKKVIVIISSLTIVTLSSIAIFTKNPKAEVDIESSGTLDSLTETLSGTQIKGYVKNKKPELMYVSKDSIKLFVNEDMKVYNKMASADDKLEVLGKDEDKGYYKIKTDDGREFFVKTDDLTISSFAENIQNRIEQLEQSIRKMKIEQKNKSDFFMLFNN